MAQIYADLIRKGLKTLDDVPKKLRKEVEEILARDNNNVEEIVE